MRIKSLVLPLMVALVAVPSLAFASQLGLSVDSAIKADSKVHAVNDFDSNDDDVQQPKKERKEDRGKRAENFERGRKFGHAFQELSVESRTDLKAQLKALHEEFRAKLKALRAEFAAKVKALIDAFLEAEADAETSAEVRVNGS